MTIPTKIISGGQTGVDRAALDVAIQFNIPHGGWCPKGRLAELGQTIPEKYQLVETATGEFRERTALNIRDSDGTLIFVPDDIQKISDGTLFTIEEARRLNKSLLIITLPSMANDKHLALKWLTDHRIKILNIAEPRASQWEKGYPQVLDYLVKLFTYSYS